MSTTDFNTKIGVIFSTSASVSAGVYETYFLYHKTIFVTINLQCTDLVYRIKKQSSLVMQNIVSNSSTDHVGSNAELNPAELLNLDDRTLQVADRMLSDIHEIKVTLSKDNYCNGLKMVFLKYEDFLEMTKRSVLTENNIL